jgi:hypothetical protein
VDKELKKLVRRLEQRGCTVVHGGKHLKVKDAEGRTVYTLPSTPSGQTWRIRAESQLKKMGLL